MAGEAEKGAKDRICHTLQTRQRAEKGKSIESVKSGAHEDVTSLTRQVMRSEADVDRAGTCLATVVIHPNCRRLIPNKLKNNREREKQASTHLIARRESGVEIVWNEEDVWEMAECGQFNAVFVLPHRRVHPFSKIIRFRVSSPNRVGCQREIRMMFEMDGDVSSVSNERGCRLRVMTR
ncbi:hypothetical protein BLNAU_18187 [Blattamonas nauphoetae]|uniref:Uncharacterized protein n=1 Tax=Blattamonas nauphoetae TaxID=2049346 RepID=A0ABQ9X5L3_9EUKA|nr:hypothetical protein BLNAU_18187 [Blattamonas nauphoetae]